MCSLVQPGVKPRGLALCPGQSSLVQRYLLGDLSHDTATASWPRQGVEWRLSTFDRLFACIPSLCAVYLSLVQMGGVFVFLGLFAASFATQLWHLHMTYGLVTGVGFSLSFAPGVIAVAQYFKKKRALANGFAMAGSGVGTFVMALVTNRLLLEMSWRWTLRVLGIAGGVVIFLCGTSFLPIGISAKTAITAARVAVRVSGLQLFRKLKGRTSTARVIVVAQSPDARCGMEANRADAHISIDTDSKDVAGNSKLVASSETVGQATPQSPDRADADVWRHDRNSDDITSPSALPLQGGERGKQSEPSSRVLVPVMHEHGFHRVTHCVTCLCTGSRVFCLATCWLCCVFCAIGAVFRGSRRVRVLCSLHPHGEVC